MEKPEGSYHSSFKFIKLVLHGFSPRGAYYVNGKQVNSKQELCMFLNAENNFVSNGKFATADDYSQVSTIIFDNYATRISVKL